MLRLASTTPEAWAQAADRDLHALLLDHTHCEKKAASTAITLLFRYPKATALAKPLAELAEEELTHFRLMLDALESRGFAYGPQKPSAYAGRLLESLRPTEPDRLVDTLLCCALIEARSCERMKLLSETLSDPALRKLYADLLASEARHHQLYVDLATQFSSREQVHARLQALASHEAQILVGQEENLRMHSAWPA